MREIRYILLMAISFSFCVSFGAAGQLDMLVEDVPNTGTNNAIKRAYQMVCLTYIPQKSIIANKTMRYKGGKEYQGLMYSSVKELHTYVGADVSFHTFMTALHNPRSVLYSENVSQPPYHGTNCGAYYGTVCSGLVAYAFNLRVYKKCLDYASSDYFQLVDSPSIKNVQLADVIHSNSHVQLITRIKRDRRTGKAEEIEICESVKSGCRRLVMTGAQLEKKIAMGKRLYRYKYLDDVVYEPLTNFVALTGEKLSPFIYNDDICTSHGDRACFVVGDSVVLNIGTGFNTLEIYKDSVLFSRQKFLGKEDIVVKGLPYGNYKARLVGVKGVSGFTSWKMIDVNVEVDSRRKVVSFHSDNASPVYLDFASISGNRPTKGVFEFSKEDIKKGSVNVSSYNVPKKKLKEGIYVRVHFECDFGRVMNKPIRWE